MNQSQSPLAAQSQPEKPRLTANMPVLHKFLPNTPLMCVNETVWLWDQTLGKNKIVGISCYWFDETGIYHCQIFSSLVLREATLKEISRARPDLAKATVSA